MRAECTGGEAAFERCSRTVPCKRTCGARCLVAGRSTQPTHPAKEKKAAPAHSTLALANLVQEMDSAR